jgi:hypothetical protein
MKFSEIKKELSNSWQNGVYIELPYFRSNERIYLNKNGTMFHEKRYADGTHSVLPTSLTDYEIQDETWQVRPF